MIGLLNCPITNCPITTWASELVGNGEFFKPITIEEIVIFMIKGKIFEIGLKKN